MSRHATDKQSAAVSEDSADQQCAAVSEFPKEEVLACDSRSPKMIWANCQTIPDGFTGDDWDVVVIGAGPAGAFAAHQLANRFKRILLVDKSEFPRSKVCGCCLNSAAVDLLEANGLAKVLSSSNAIPLQHLSLYMSGATASVNLPKSYSISRSNLDAQLVEAAVDRGVTFLSKSTAAVLNTADGARLVSIINTGSNQTIRAKIVLVADGLNGRSLAKFPEFDFTISADSRFGCGTIVSDPQNYYRSGRIYMACAAQGYVGLVRLEDGRLDIAAALDREFSRVQGDTARAAATILELNHLPLPQTMLSSHWSGTESLTRTRKRIAGDRIFVIGDSCGYAEPFTGEGIAWALASGAAAANLVTDEWSDSLIDRWQTKHRQLIHARQNRSIMIARVLRNNTVRNLAMPLISALPAVASSLISHITHPISSPSDAA